MTEVLISLGSNVGNRRENINKAIDMLAEYKEIQVTEISSYYETEPIGYVDQEKFINAVLSLETSYTPWKLLRLLQNIEQALKRKRSVRWGPRTIDLDIIFFGDLIIESKDLTVPHPRLTERAFVLIPLVEIMPSYIHPLTQKSLLQHLKELNDDKGVYRFNQDS